MSAFKSKIVISPVNGGRTHWILEEPIVYQSDLLGEEVIVPAGFIYDGSSLPPWLKAIPIISFFVKDKIVYPGAAALHDFGYRFGVWPRKTTDALYQEALLVEKAHPVRARLRYWGVRAGGWISWRRHRKADAHART